MKKFFVLGLVLFFFLPSHAQSDSCHLRITLLTCAPGEELYSSFGHTAVRVQDVPAGTDLVFNYGTFEFSPEFYSKFILGKLLYYLSIEEYPNFVYQYQYESRSIVEQEILLGCEQKQILFRALLDNARDENRSYRYDFLFDNCTTRAGDMIVKHAGDSVHFNNILPPATPSFRDLIHSYLDLGGQYWSKLGIDILLGAKLDREVTNRQAMFLPDYLLKGMDSARVNGRPLVSPARKILFMPSPLNNRSLFRPAVVFGLLFFLILALSFVNRRWSRITLLVFDVIFFFFLGLAGLLLLFMWFGTDHAVCANNYNLLWALPTHVVMAFLVPSGKSWVKKYFRFVSGLSIALLLLWFLIPQQLHASLTMIVAITMVRSFFISKKQQHAGKTDQVSK